MRRALWLALVFLPMALFAQDVAEEELRAVGSTDIEFINYEGPHDRIESDEEIRAIGRALATGISGGEAAFEYAGKYRVIHAVDPGAAEGLDADIIVFLPTARVDHIDNVRRIISGFLAEAYGYRRPDADILARFVTIYNAVSRGNMDFFSSRYKAVVTGNLSAENAGLSRRYDEWPGKSRVVIPLSSGAPSGSLGTVEPGELGNDQVVEELRSQPDMGVEDRQQFVDLTERVVAEREQAVAEQSAELTAEEQRITEQQSEVANEQAQVAAELEQLPPGDERQAELVQQQSELSAEQAALAEAQTAVEQQREELQSQTQQIAELTAQVREEREQIARDARALLDERDISTEVRGLEGDAQPVYFIQVREESGTVLGQLVQINPLNGVFINRSAENSIVSRAYTYLGDKLLVIAAEGTTGRLATFDVTSLEEATRGADEIFLGSALAVHGDPAVAYAVVRDSGEWYVGRFGNDLALVERSVIAVNPYTTFAFGSDKVWIQTRDDRIVALSLVDLRVSP